MYKKYNVFFILNLEMSSDPIFGIDLYLAMIHMRHMSHRNQIDLKFPIIPHTHFFIRIKILRLRIKIRIEIRIKIRIRIVPQSVVHVIHVVHVVQSVVQSIKIKIRIRIRIRIKIKIL